VQADHTPFEGRPAVPESTEQSRQPAQNAVPQNAPRCPTGEIGAQGEGDVLSPKQWLAIELMAAGRSLAQVCARCGVDRKTLYRWRHDDSRFLAELRARRRALFDGAADRLAALLPQAVRVLSLQLRDPTDRASFHAATAILRIANVKELLTDDGDEDGGDGGDAAGVRRSRAGIRDIDDAEAQL
jgi:hypothetical protein